jgi:hypothetical protein
MGYWGHELTYGHLFPDREEISSPRSTPASGAPTKIMLTIYRLCRLATPPNSLISMREGSDQRTELVDQRGIEPLTSPVRGVRSTN